MVYIYIEDKSLLTKIISYLEISKIEYTTDIKDNFKLAIIAEINKKTDYIISNYKTIFIAYKEENRIYNNFLNNKNFKYQQAIKMVLENCYKVIFSMEYFKSIFNDISTKIYIIHKSNPLIETRKILNFSKYIIVNDFDYKNIDLMLELSNKYDYKYYYIGYKKLNKQEKIIYNKLPSNVIKIKYHDYFTYIKLVKQSYMIIDFNSSNIDINYIKIPILLKKKILLNKIPYYNKYLIANKHAYYFDSLKDLLNKIKKIKENRLSNLTEEAYFKVILETDEKIALKYKEIVN